MYVEYCCVMQEVDLMQVILCDVVIQSEYLLYVEH